MTIAAVVAYEASPARQRDILKEHDEDLKLVRRMQAGDDAAFEEFAGLTFKAVYRFTLNRMNGDRDVAQEIVQTAMVKALARLDSYRGESSLTTWLCGCCRNEMLMHFRRQRTAAPHVEIDDLTDGSASHDRVDAEAALLGRERVERVHMALDQLPRSYSQALEWMYIERLPVKEIASRLGVHVKAAESLLTRARAAFRTRYIATEG